MRYTYYSIVLLTAFLAPTTHAAVAPYFKPSDFAQCVVADMSKKLSAAQLTERLKTADGLRVQGGKELLATMDNGSFLDPLATKLAPFSQQDMSEVMAFHSTPLMDYAKINWGKEAFHENVLGRLTELYQSFNEDKKTDLVNFKDIDKYLDSMIAPNQTPANLGDHHPVFIKMQWAANLYVDKVAKLLMRLPPNSLTHYDLLERVTQMFDGDALTALGVIGLMFDTERVNVKSRDKRLVLASRLKPIFADSKDHFGDNYHFWMYMNAAIQGKYRPAKWMSVSFEGLQRDWDDMRADNLGLEAGRLIRANLGKPASCALRNSQPGGVVSPGQGGAAR